MRLIYTLIFCLFIESVSAQQTITHIVYFDFDAVKPTSVSEKELISFLESLKHLTVSKITIEGHTDKEGDRRYNANLSRTRAENVNSLIKSYLSPEINSVINYKGEDSLLTTQDEKQAINRRVVIAVDYDDEKKVVTEIESFHEDVETQRFIVNLDDTVFITAKDGTRLKISPGSIQNKKGQLVHGQAEILIREYYKPGDIILSGLNTIADKGLLQTGGMFNMQVVQGVDTMATNTLKPVSIKMPVVNNLNGSMNVFIMGNKTDSSTWKNTGRVFKRVFSYWDWPRNDKVYNFTAPYIEYKNWKVGHRYTDEYYAKETTWWFAGIPFGNSSEVKSIVYTIEKIDSLTLKTSLKLKFRNRGQRKYGTEFFDTSFLVNYRKAEYEGLASNINWINCDRFLNYPNVSDFYVSTPDFRGANVMVYFKNIHAFLPAFPDKKQLYTVSKVPGEQKVWIIAYGRKDGEYYFAKQDFTTTKGVRVNLSLSKISEAEFRKEFKGF